MITADEIRSFKDRHGLSVRELAREVGVNPSTVHRWLNEGQTPDRFREEALRRVMRQYDAKASDS